MRWTKEEENLVINNFRSLGGKGLVDLMPNRTRRAINAKAKRLGVSKNYTWNDTELDLLKDLWVNEHSMDNLLKAFPNRTYSSLMSMARLLGIKTHGSVDRSRKGNLYYLNDINSDNSYWWGFIMADGCFTKRNELSIKISKKDNNHLALLANKLITDIHIYDDMVHLTIGDSYLIPKWKDKFNMLNAKTYNPPNLEMFYTEDLFIKFFIGFTDGDGCIWISNKQQNTPSTHFRIEIHTAWTDTLIKWKSLLKEFYDIESTIKIVTRPVSEYRKKETEYVQLIINYKQDRLKLYEFSKTCEYKLKRKWNQLKFHTVQ